MRSGVRLGFGSAFLGAVLAAASAAGAATVTIGGYTLQIDDFTRAEAVAAKVAKDAFQAPYTNLRTEGFDGLAAGGTGLAQTAVGSFAPLGDAGSGQSVIGDGAELQVRRDSDMAWGRYDTDLPIGGQWLDSNDNTGIEWRIEGLGAFNALGFFVLDPADVGGRFAIRVGDTLFADLAGAAGQLENGSILFVRILLDAAVDSLTVGLMHDRTNDGFGIDGAMMAQVAHSPVPPAALLFGSGLLAVAGLRRRRPAKAGR